MSARKKRTRRKKAPRCIIIAGPNGVGKTTLVRALVAVFHSAGLAVLLAAPTGRAAKRLAETTDSPAQTIHRLLETSPDTGQFQRDEENPLEADVVIVDESSMMDVPLLDAVLRAMPAQAAIILVGDADQLPSIGPGPRSAVRATIGMVPCKRPTHRRRSLRCPLKPRGRTGCARFRPRRWRKS